jgi:hypothetical protein
MSTDGLPFGWIQIYAGAHHLVVWKFYQSSEMDTVIPRSLHEVLESPISLCITKPMG